jgi:hypothetical protein
MRVANRFAEIMKPALPSAEILNDLIIDNWQLRWQVIEIFSRLNQQLKNHAHGSREQAGREKLGRRLATLLNGPQDQNLHLILTAAYFLGGGRFIFMVFRELGIDDSPEFYPGLAEIRKALSEPDRSPASFIDYFRLLFSSPRPIESTTAIAAELAIQIFSPETALPLLLELSPSGLRRKFLEQLAAKHPHHDFNDQIFSSPETLGRHPELLVLARLPLAPEACSHSVAAAEKLLQDPDPGPRETALRAIARLGLRPCRTRLEELSEPELPLLIARACLGDSGAGRELLRAASSWRPGKRLAALPGLACDTTPAALQRLEKSARKGDPTEKRLAHEALARNPSPEALATLRRLLFEAPDLKQRRSLLASLSRHAAAGPDPELARLLADWHNHAELYPELLEALAICADSQQLIELAASLKPPLLAPHLQELALFLTRYADAPEIRDTLNGLLFDLDWTFTYRLLLKLGPALAGKDLAILLKLLQESEELRGLSISARLTSTSDIPRFSEALADFLNRHPDRARELLERFIRQLFEGRLAAVENCIDRFRQLPAELQKTILSSDDPGAVRLETRLPLLHFQELLCQLPVNGGDALALVVHRTRRYNGFFRQAIIARMLTLIEHDPTLNTTEALPILHSLLDYLRQRPGFDSLRAQLLLRMNAIQRRARDLKIHLKVVQDRDLRILSITRKTSPAHP